MYGGAELNIVTRDTTDITCCAVIPVQSRRVEADEREHSIEHTSVLTF